jgi:hypothetical protein
MSIESTAEEEAPRASRALRNKIEAALERLHQAERELVEAALALAEGKPLAPSSVEPDSDAGDPTAR